MNDFLQQIAKRRSYYGISNEEVLPPAKLKQLVQEAVRNTPSAFNSQNGRVVLLLGKQHEKLWQITEDALAKIVPPEAFAATKEKLASFAAGYGTVLFFEDMNTVESLQKQFPTYADNFPIWSRQAGGMLQLVVWTALESEGLGASLQHYNPLIDAEVAKTWKLPASWQLVAQMPFGKPTAVPGAKTFLPVEERMLVFGEE